MTSLLSGFYGRSSIQEIGQKRGQLKVLLSRRGISSSSITKFNVHSPDMIPLFASRDLVLVELHGRYIVVSNGLELHDLTDSIKKNCGDGLLIPVGCRYILCCTEASCDDDGDESVGRGARFSVLAWDGCKTVNNRGSYFVEDFGLDGIECVSVGYGEVVVSLTGTIEGREMLSLTYFSNIGLGNPTYVRVAKLRRFMEKWKLYPFLTKDFFGVVAECRIDCNIDAGDYTAVWFSKTDPIKRRQKIPYLPTDVSHELKLYSEMTENTIYILACKGCNINKVHLSENTYGKKELRSWIDPRAQDALLFFYKRCTIISFNCSDGRGLVIRIISPKNWEQTKLFPGLELLGKTADNCLVIADTMQQSIVLLDPTKSSSVTDVER